MVEVKAKHLGQLGQVDDTRGLTVTYQGKLIPASFFSSAGGYTENSENVWGAYQPFLRGVPDFDQNTPHYQWEKKFTPAELQDIVHKAGYNIDALQAIELSPLTKQPINASDRGISGRVKSLRFISAAGSVSITGADLRRILVLNSTLFDIKIATPIQKTLEFEITDGNGNVENKTVEVNLPPAQEQSGINDKKNIRRITGRATETIVF